MNILLVLYEPADSLLICQPLPEGRSALDFTTTRGCNSDSIDIVHFTIKI